MSVVVSEVHEVSMPSSSQPVQLHRRPGVQIAEAALADEWVTHGDRLALQRRVLRLGKPPRRWRRPPWAAAALSEPREVCLLARPLTSVIGASQAQLL